jgi:hypothetical protein
MASDLQKLLENKQLKTNQNKKFPDSNQNASVFKRLQYNFTPDDPSILNVSKDVLDNLKKTPKQLKDWQADDMANNVVSRGKYFTNSVGGLLSAIQNSIAYIGIHSDLAIWRQDGNVWQKTFPLRILKNAADALSVVVGLQILHTMRLSNLVEINPETAELPHYEQVIPVCRQLAYIVYQTDDIQDNRPVVGCFTSLFIKNYYSFVASQMDRIEKLVKESLYMTIIDNPDYIDEENTPDVPPTIEAWSTYLTDEQIRLEVDFIEGRSAANRVPLKDPITERRLHDERYWTNTKKILQEYQFLRSLNDGEFQQTMLTKVVGTEELKQRLKIKDVPVEPAYTVILNYDGSIQYIPRAPNTNTISYPSFNLRTEPIEREVDYVNDLPEPLEITGILQKYEDLPKDAKIGDTYYILDLFKTYRWNGLSWYEIEGHLTGDEVYITTTGEIYVWNGTSWGLKSLNIANSQITLLDDYINQFVANSTNVVFGNNTFNLSNGAFITETVNGIWSPNSVTTICNLGNTDYILTGLTLEGVENTELYFRIEFLGTNTVIESSDTSILERLPAGNCMTITIITKPFSEGNTTDTGTIVVQPGIEIPIKVIGNTSSFGVLLPNAVSQQIGSVDSKLAINTVNGPYELLDPNSTEFDRWTWRNDSGNSVTISSITDITPVESSSDMLIEFYQATTPNTLNASTSVLWYANVTPYIEFPNTFTYIVETTDGQERLLSLTVPRGAVDDNTLFDEIINTNPDIVVTNNAFDIRIYGGKPNTNVSLSGPNISTTRTLNANGFVLIANNTITSNGTYTYLADFVGTGHRRTITKAIFS